MFKALRALTGSDLRQQMRDPRTSPVQVFTHTTPFKEMVPTSHLAIAAKAGAGLSTFLRRVAQAANREERPVLFVSRIPNDSADLFSGMNLMHEISFMCGGQLFRTPDELTAWQKKVRASANEMAKRPGAVIILDDVPGLDDIAQVRSLITQGAHVINSAHVFPDLITHHTTCMGFAGVNADPSGIFADERREYFPVGRAVREGMGVPRTYVQVAL